MGSQISSLDYKNIREVKDLVNINDNNKRKYIHIIKFNNNKEKIIKLNKNEEVKFELRYKYTKMFRDIAKIQYYKISEIIKTNIDENKYKLRGLGALAFEWRNVSAFRPESRPQQPLLNVAKSG